MSDRTWVAILVAIVVAVVGWQLWSAAEVGDVDVLLAPDPTPAASPELRDARRSGEATAPVIDLESENAEDLVEAPIDFARVDRDCEISGYVKGHEGRPVAGAKIQALHLPWRRVPSLYTPPDGGRELRESTWSRSDGSFALRLRAGIRVNLVVDAPDYGIAEIANVPAGDRLEVQLEAAARLRVRCVNASGKPVVGADLRLSMQSISQHRSGLSDSVGNCVFDRLSAGSAHIGARHAELARSGSNKVELQSGHETEVRITFPEGRPVLGRVTDAETGAPISGARVGLDRALREFLVTDGNGYYAVPSFVSFRQTCLNRPA
ncbi:MAG: carboxypeptidase regulatory-like domain-containing protein [Salinibacterium sp.]|nr:carboxypeptidase regulatory-like domain-containing protein [Salinibacterium sp.]